MGKKGNLKIPWKNFPFRISPDSKWNCRNLQNSDLEKKLEEQRYLTEEAEHDKEAVEDSLAKLKQGLKDAQDRIEELEEENDRLTKEVALIVMQLRFVFMSCRPRHHSNVTSTVSQNLA